jgi:hypothetical protein
VFVFKKGFKGPVPVGQASHKASPLSSISTLSQWKQKFGDQRNNKIVVYSEILSLVKGFRNGAVYGTKIKDFLML